MKLRALRSQRNRPKTAADRRLGAQRRVQTRPAAGRVTMRPSSQSLSWAGRVPLPAIVDVFPGAETGAVMNDRLDRVRRRLLRTFWGGSSVPPKNGAAPPPARCANTRAEPWRYRRRSVPDRGVEAVTTTDGPSSCTSRARTASASGRPRPGPRHDGDSRPQRSGRLADDPVAQCVREDGVVVHHRPAPGVDRWVLLGHCPLPFRGFPDRLAALSGSPRE